MLDRDLLEPFDQRNLKCLIHHGYERLVLVRDADGEAAAIKRNQQYLHDPQRPRERALRHGNV
jgi:hypothetical protein